MLFQRDMNFDSRAKYTYFTSDVAREINMQYTAGKKEIEISDLLNIDKKIVVEALMHKNGNIYFNPICFYFSNYYYLDYLNNIIIAKKISISDPLPKESININRNSEELIQIISILSEFNIISFDSLYAFMKSYDFMNTSKPLFIKKLKRLNFIIFEGFVLPKISQPFKEWRLNYCNRVLSELSSTIFISQFKIELPMSVNGNTYVTKSPKENCIYLFGGFSMSGLTSLLIFDEESMKDGESYSLQIMQKLIPVLNILYTHKKTVSLDVESVHHPILVYQKLVEELSGSVVAYPGSYIDCNPMSIVWESISKSIKPENLCYSKTYQLIRNIRIQWAELKSKFGFIQSIMEKYENSFNSIVKMKGDYGKFIYNQMKKEKS